MFKKLCAVLTLSVSLLAVTLSSAFAVSVNVQKLIDGNARYVSGVQSSLIAHSGAATRGQVALGQHPFAVVLDCADSRVPPEVIFDQGLGDLFVVRVAGNILDKHQIASIQYAIEHTGSKTVVVLGHERCGAVGAAFGSLDATGAPIGMASPATGYYALTPELQYLVDTPTLKDSVIESKSLGANNATECALINVDKVYAELMLDPLMTDPAVGVEVVKAFYDLDDGVVTFNTTATSYYNVKASSSNPAQGSIAPSGDSAVLPGGNQPFVITPAAGYALSEILVDGKPATLPAGPEFVLTNVSADSTVVASFASTAPVAKKVEWVGALPTGVDGALLVWWPSSDTANATYSVFVNGALQQSGITGNSYTTPILTNAGSPYTVTVQVSAAGFQPSVLTAATPVAINKSAAAPAWLGVTSNGGSTIKLWWPSVTTPGATYEITETVGAATNVYTAPATTILTAGGLKYVLFTGKASGSYTYTVRTLASGYNPSAYTNGPVSPVVVP